MTTENVLVLGATSGIAKALCQEMGKRGCHFILAGRDEEELGKIATDLHIRYRVNVYVEAFDSLHFEEHAVFVDRCVQRFEDGLFGVVLCYGHMVEQGTTENDFSAARRTIDINFTSAVSLLNAFANYLASRRRGYIAAISSVAGDRGRQSNYTYGAAKAGLSAYLQGLRNRLYPVGVHVLTVKPGFVDTPMTYGLFSLPSPLVASPEEVARDIDKAIRQRKNELYSPWFWWGIMKVIKFIPESIFKRLRL